MLLHVLLLFYCSVRATRCARKANNERTGGKKVTTSKGRLCNAVTVVGFENSVEEWDAADTVGYSSLQLDTA